MRVVLLAKPATWKLDLLHAIRSIGHDAEIVADNSPAETVEAACDGADVLVWARNQSRNPAGDVAGMLRRIEARGVRTVGVHFDLYRGLPRRERRIGHQPWWTCQTVWTPDDDPRPWPPGVNHHYLPPALGDRHIGRGTVRDRFRHDVVFVGSRGYHAEHPWRRRLLAFLQRTYGRRFAWYGGGSPLGRCDGQNLSDLFASSAVVVGDACLAGWVYGYWSDRLPITLGRGGFLVHPRVDGMAEQGFVDGETLAVFRPGDERDLRRVIDMWLDRDRSPVVDRAIELVRERHLMTHRAATILEAL